MFLAIAIGFASGNGVVVAQHYGAKNERSVRENAATGILFLMVLGFISALIGMIVARPAFTYLLNVDRSIVGLTFIQRAVNGFGKVMTASFTVGQRIEMYLIPEEYVNEIKRQVGYKVFQISQDSKVFKRK